MDNDYFNFIQDFTWLRSVTIPMLGICAGMQFLGLIHGSQRIRCLEIGMIPIEIIRSTPSPPFSVSASTPSPLSSASASTPASSNHLVSCPTSSSPNSLEGYNLHRYAILLSEELIILARSEGSVQAFGHREKPVFGVMFHPEVRNPEVIEQFITEYCCHGGKRIEPGNPDNGHL